MAEIKKMETQLFTRAILMSKISDMRPDTVEKVIMMKLLEMSEERREKRMTHLYPET